MGWSEKERIIAARKIMLGFLIIQVQEKDYSILPKMYEMAKIDNKKLLEKSHTIRNIYDSPSNTIFSDMVYLIYDESENNSSILQIFYDLCKKMFPAKVAEYEYMVELHESGDMHKWNKYLRNTYIEKSDKILLHLFHMYLPIYFNNEAVIEVFDEEYRESIEFITSTFLQTDQNIDDDIYTFNTDENIFCSGLFEKYLNKRKIELAEYLSNLYGENVTDKNLCSFIHKILKSKAEEIGTPLSNSVENVVKTITSNIIVEQNGGMTWYEAITNDGRTGYVPYYNYCPDVEKLIRMYFKEYVKLEWRKYMEENDEGFSKVYLAKECVPDNVKEVYTNIMYLYNLDVMCKLFNDVKDDYYLNFSWEKISHKDVVARYNTIISEMEDNIKFLNAKLESEKQSKSLLREEFAKKERSEDTSILYEQTITKLNKKIDEKDEEIILLKRQLESKEEYTQLLLNKDDPDVTREIDVTLLQQKRYLFVGYANEALPELRRTFPNSIFMDSESAVINNIQVDGIVMLIKYMSHAMFYKVNASGLVKETPIVRCNTKNINTIYNKMMDLLY